MKTAAIVALAATALAAPTSQPKIDSFTLISARSASPIHLSPINAQDTFFWIGKKTKTYCPPEVGSACPKGEPVTALNYGSGGLSMNTEVPGGQNVYIGPKGALRYTIAHSGAIPAGSTTKGWAHSQPVSKHQAGNLHRADAKQGLLACPEAGAYKVYVETPGYCAEEHKGCLGFEALSTEFDGTGAWQYE